MKIAGYGVAVIVATSMFEAYAGPYSDDLSKCLVRSTTSADKSILVKWVFAIAAVHPALSTIAAVSDEQRTELNKTTARIVETLLTEICKPETRDALKYEGQQTLETSFGVLGQVAMRELFSDPGAAKELERFASFIDQGKIEKLVAPAP